MGDMGGMTVPEVDLPDISNIEPTDTGNMTVPLVDPIPTDATDTSDVPPVPVPDEGATPLEPIESCPSDCEVCFKG